MRNIDNNHVHKNQMSRETLKTINRRRHILFPRQILLDTLWGFAHSLQFWIMVRTSVIKRIIYYVFFWNVRCAQTFIVTWLKDFDFQQLGFRLWLSEILVEGCNHIRLILFVHPQQILQLLDAKINIASLASGICSSSSLQDLCGNNLIISITKNLTRNSQLTKNTLILYETWKHF